MNKSELLENYTAEQLAEMVVVAMESKEDSEKMIQLITNAGNDLGRQLEEKQNEINCLKSKTAKYQKAFEDAKKERDCQIAEYQKKIDELKKQLDRSQTTITQIDEILEELFGVKHDAVEYGEFEQILRDKVAEKVADFLPTEPIKVADILISAEGECESLTIGNKKYTDTYRIFDISELRQIAEHLLVYCNANGEEAE